MLGKSAVILFVLEESVVNTTEEYYIHAIKLSVLVDENCMFGAHVNH